ncbi:hypothetical protein ABMY35_10940 [Pseudoalteromonas sp. BZB3]|uniref:hypothetical protein n=1 Tax=unclassified Pseudoalteromonas TaxID=194690 RepID=UPI0032C3E62F
MELSKQSLRLIFGGGIIVSGSDSPELPKKSQAVEPNQVESSSSDPTAPVVPPKP